MERNCEEIVKEVDTSGEKFYDTIIENMKAIRIQKGITVDILSTYTGIDKSHIYRLESKKRKIGLESLRRIAVVLEVPLSALLKDSSRLEDEEELREIDLLLHSMDKNEVIYFQRMMKAYYREKVNEKRG